jgi:hypothetical protein
METRLGMVAHTCKSYQLGRKRLEGSQFKANLGKKYVPLLNK